MGKMTSVERLKDIEIQAKSSIQDAISISELEEIRIRYLGRKGVLTNCLRNLKDLPLEIRPTVGKIANEIKENLLACLQKRAHQLKSFKDIGKDVIDYTLPGFPVRYGTKHPVNIILDEIIEIFYGMGFSVEEGPEIESDYYNFEALNIPIDHPARDMHDTFYIEERVLLRTHTSPVQIRVMESQAPPIKVIAPGRVYRRDTDVSHTPMFHQVEGLMVDENISFSNLKGVLVDFLHNIFDPKISVRFRPSFFPFTEPSAEVDITCTVCKGKGCRVCGGEGWLEILGAGMVHPAVFKAVNYDSRKYTGFAFGLGVERIAMLKYGIDDIRLLFENDIRFLNQFS